MRVKSFCRSQPRYRGFYGGWVLTKLDGPVEMRANELNDVICAENTWNKVPLHFWFRDFCATEVDTRGLSSGAPCV